ncbi:L-Proline / Glycine betaine transporter ProP [Liberibacter crescens BT-1]|uniref:L-Proline / Glycine betaine transporter ProP n=1 Tax=Liberibacter crescens (strain BT-1) TaxID=1215343 RepID=L0EV62_LIBCB|nr:MFS transporter [Liberibacter crescens]AGA64286.1 L-Proline / Glycine betaine transporter ProP [Liberibacter crescens BT-1]
MILSSLCSLRLLSARFFFPPDIPEWLRLTQTFAIFATGYLARPFGGILLAHFGDLIGRKRVFFFSIFLMAITTLGISLIPTYTSIGVTAPILLLLFRVAQGIAIGGEIPGAWTYISEHTSSRYVGRSCGFVLAGLLSGIVLGSLITTMIEYFISNEHILGFAWRIPFIIGGMFGFFTVWLRRWLQETPVFLEMKKIGALNHKLPLKKVLRDHRESVVIAIILSWVLSAGIIVLSLMAPTLLQTIYHYDRLTALSSNLLATTFLVIGVCCSGFLIDRVNSGIFLLLAGIVFAITSFTFYSWIGVSKTFLYSFYTITQFSFGMIGAIPYVMVRLFPSVIRFSGISFSYNIAYAISGSITPIAVSTLAKFVPMAPAYYMLFIAVVTIIVGTYLKFKTTLLRKKFRLEELLIQD